MKLVAPKAIGVTGANGFVGRAVCASLQARGYTVRALVRNAASHQISCANDVQSVGDIGPQTEWHRALNGLDVVIHCAAHVHQMGKDADTGAAYHLINTEGTAQLARCAVEAGVHRLVFLSTVKVLGEQTPPGRPFRHDSTSNPLDPYADSKWAAERALHQIAAETCLEVVVIRPPLVYGPGVGANFAALIRLVQAGWPLPLNAVNNRRSMVGLRNLVDLIRVCAVKPAAVGQTFLVSDDDDLSTPELVRRLARALNRKPHLWSLPPALLTWAGRLTGRTAQIERLTSNLQVDIGKTRELLKWHPPFSVAEELALTVTPHPHETPF